MSAQDKLGLGLALFVVCFLIAFLVIPPSVYRRYRTDVASRSRSRPLKIAMGIVMLLSLPYFYDELVGFDNRGLSMMLEWAIGACAYLVVIDVAWFIYRHYGPPSRRDRLRRPS